MYNRYLPEDTAYPPVGRPAARPGGNAGYRLPDYLAGREGLGALLSGGQGGGLSGLWRALHLEGLDSGDVLLLLIVLYLLVEGDDLDLVIALGLVLLLGLGDPAEG